jgi:hypothetical protein
LLALLLLTSVRLYAVQELLLLQLQTGLLGWEARKGGEEGKAAAFDSFLELLHLETDSVTIGGQAGGGPQPAEEQHILKVMGTTQQIISTPEQVEQLLGLLAVQQPSVFRAAAGEGQRAAMLHPLLACLHLECVVRAVIQPGSKGYAMHVAAWMGFVAQLRVLQMLGADLDLSYTLEGVPYTPLRMACCNIPYLGDVGLPSSYRRRSHKQQQQEQRQEAATSTLMCQGSVMCDLELDSMCTEELQQQVAVLMMLTNSAGFSTVELQRQQPSILATAAYAGLHPVVQFLLPHAKATLSYERQLPADKHMLSRATQRASSIGNRQHLRLLMTAAGGPASEDAKAALCLAMLSMDLAAMEVLLKEERVSVDCVVEGDATALNAFLRTPDKEQQVGGACCIKQCQCVP